MASGGAPRRELDLVRVLEKGLAEVECALSNATVRVRELERENAALKERMRFIEERLGWLLQS